MIDSNSSSSNKIDIDGLLNSPDSQLVSTEMDANQFRNSSLQELPSFLKPLVAIFALLVVLVGTGVAIFVSQKTQDVRQQAAETDKTASLVLKTENAMSAQGATASEKTNIDLIVNSGVDSVDVVGIQFVANISGDIPDDFSFTPETIQNLNLLVNTIEENESGKKMSIAYLTEPPSSYPASDDDIRIGSIQFTLQDQEKLTISFDDSLTKIVRKADSQNILQSVGSFTYEGEAEATQTPFPSGILDPSPIPTLTPSPFPSNEPTITQLPSLTPTNTPGQGGIATQTPTPTQVTLPVPTSTPTGSVNPTNTLSPSPTFEASPNPIGDMCLSASVLNSNRGDGEVTRIGDTINVMCGEVASAHHYEFRITKPSGSLSNISALSSGARQSAPFQIDQSGRYYAQCRVCTSENIESCSAWESLE